MLDVIRISKIEVHPETQFTVFSRDKKDDVCGYHDKRQSFRIVTEIEINCQEKSSKTFVEFRLSIGLLIVVVDQTQDTFSFSHSQKYHSPAASCNLLEPKAFKIECENCELA